MLQRLFRSALAWGFVSIGLRGISAIVLLPLMLQRMSPSDLGIWYIFLGVLAIMPVLDCGFAPTAGRMLAPLFRLEEAPDSGTVSLLSPKAVLSTMRVWYRRVGLGALCCLGIGGGWWVSIKASNLPDRHAILGAWLLFCPIFGLTVAVTFWRAVLFGMNAMTSGQLIAISAQVVQISLTIWGLLHGWGIFALVAGNLATNVVLVFAIRHWTRQNAVLRRHWEAAPRIDGPVLKKLWQTSFRLLLNTLGVYLVGGANALIGSSAIPLDQIASYGISFQLLIVCAQLSMLWIDVKQPVFAALRASDPGALQRLFVRRIRWALVCFILTAGGVIVLGPFLLGMIHARTLPLPTAQLFLLAVFLFLYAHHSMFESLSLCLDHNPFAVPFVIAGGVSCLFSAWLVHPFGIWALIVVPLVTQALYNNWWTVAVGLRQLGLEPKKYFHYLFRGIPEDCQPTTTA